MKNLIIIGAGGMGREVYHLASRCSTTNNFIIKGFLDDGNPNLNEFSFNYPPLLGNISDYQIEDNDVFACSIGDVKAKAKIIDYMEAKGAEFVSLIDPSAYIERTASIDYGALIFHDVHVGSEAIIGRHVMLQSYSAIGHDVIIGDYTRIDPKVSCVGGTKIGNCVTLHTMSFINHKVRIGDGATIGAMSMVIRSVKSETTVFGIPAKEL